MTIAKIKDRLRASRALIDTPGKWNQGALGHDAAGRIATQSGRPVVTRCAAGAICDACESSLADWNEVSAQLRRSINRHRLPSLRNIALTTWNDKPERSHAEVMLAFDRAIEDVQIASN